MLTDKDIIFLKAAYGIDATNMTEQEAVESWKKRDVELSELCKKSFPNGCTVKVLTNEQVDKEEV